jgi:hypothetical protein
VLFVRIVFGGRFKAYGEKCKSMMPNNFKCYNFTKAQIIREIGRQPRRCHPEQASDLKADRSAWPCLLRQSQVGCWHGCADQIGACRLERGARFTAGWR